MTQAARPCNEKPIEGESSAAEKKEWLWLGFARAIASPLFATVLYPNTIDITPHQNNIPNTAAKKKLIALMQTGLWPPNCCLTITVVLHGTIPR
jgi:hypothetical protein